MNTPSNLRDDVDALFIPDGPYLVPTVSAIGPWSPDALHGAAIAALFAAILDQPGTTVARITMDLAASVRPVRLRCDTEDLGGGSRVQRRSANLRDDQRVVARASALYVASSSAEPNDAAGHRGTSDPAAAPPTPLVPLPESRAGWPGFESRAMALHTQRGEDIAFEGWFRLLLPAISGQTVEGLHLALAAADYSSAGTAVMLSLKKWSFMSLDLTLNMTRRPVSDWVGVRADRSILDDQGVAVAASVLHDEAGAFGHCTQTQLVQRVG